MSCTRKWQTSPRRKPAHEITFTSAYMSGQLARASEMANKSGITVGIKLL